MNKTSIKNYAIWARNELISRVSQKAYEYGVEKDSILPYDAQSINGKLLADSEKKKRQRLIGEVKHKGYDQVIEEIAYTWFNRFIALRFMEVNNYLPNKVRLFTNEKNEFKPQIIDEALHIDLSGLDKNKVIKLKEANNNEALYKELLLATCNDMSRYLPGMFKPIDDYMTLLFPTNLLREESVLGRLISDIDEDSWTDQVQIIGWLYQYYNTEPKDKTFADLKKNIKITKDTIPSATQIFTPDWIVRYMTENSLGRLWLDGHPDSDIKSNWKYYLDETEQEESVQLELNKIKVERAKLKPEDIKFLDPCMGSGHILVYAFDLLMQIYRSEGWTEREAAKSILQNNLYGLDIDERAYQLSYFALMMKARQYNRRILSEGIVPNVMAIEESNTFNKNLFERFDNLKLLAERVVNTFIDAKEYGSILNVEFTKEELDSLEDRVNEINKMSSYGNLIDQMESDQVSYEFYPLLKQARIMSQKYVCVVTNPPYMGNGGMGKKLNDYVKMYFPSTKSDLSTVFMEKNLQFCEENGYISMINIPVWMFLASYQELRKSLIINQSFINLLHFGRGIFGADFGSTSFVIQNNSSKNRIGLYYRLFDRQGAVDSIEQKEKWFFEGKGRSTINQNSFLKIPGNPLAYWVSNTVIKTFDKEKIGDYAVAVKGLDTCDNQRYVRQWEEVEFCKIGLTTSDVSETYGLKWYPYSKGGGFRRWYGFNEMVVNWLDDGNELRNLRDEAGKIKSRPQNTRYYFKEGLTWSSLTSYKLSLRYMNHSIFGGGGSAMFADKNLLYILAIINSKVGEYFLNLLNPTINFLVSDIMSIPYIETHQEAITSLVKENIMLTKENYDSFETSWNFAKHPLIGDHNAVSSSSNEEKTKRDLIEIHFQAWDQFCEKKFSIVKKNEERINELLISSYGLSGIIDSSTVERDIEASVSRSNLEREIKSLISYAVGCMFGRYSLNVDGLAYAGGEWDDSKYHTFIPDKDDIIPICDDEYFNDDITGRFIEFIKAAYGEDTLEENLRFIADALGGKGTSREVIRNYFINDFYNEHVKVYQKRPIYWQFDSGKKNGFKALVYIHRYTPDLIARMRTSYVHEQQSRYENQISMIQNRIDSATSTSERVKAEKELKKLKEQADELRVYEEKIHHWADKMEPMDLDDGVKANYAKFQELLTKIK